MTWDPARVENQRHFQANHLAFIRPISGLRRIPNSSNVIDACVKVFRRKRRMEKACQYAATLKKLVINQSNRWVSVMIIEARPWRDFDGK
jgi:hypothetical protein